MVDPELYQTKYFDIDRHPSPYFFSYHSLEPVVSLTNHGIQNVVGVLGSFSENTNQTMTITEAVLTILFKQYLGEATAFAQYSIVTRTTEHMLYMPIVVGFDEIEICNRVRIYNARDLCGTAVGTKEIESQVAY